MLADGPYLETDCKEKYLDLPNVTYVGVNKALCRLRLKRKTRLVMTDANQHVLEMNTKWHSDKDLIFPVKWYPKSGQESLFPSCRDYPYLICKGPAVITAMHYMLTQGCKNIIAFGLDLCPNSEGGYGPEGKQRIDGQDHLFQSLKDRLTDIYAKAFEAHEVQFYSRGWRYPPKLDY